MTEKKIFLIAGEKSGDLHGSKLVQALKNQGSFHFKGVVGPLMRQVGIECTVAMENFQVMGFSDVLKSLPSLYRLFYQLRNEILSYNPDAVIFIDYPGFNLRLAKALRKKGFKGKLIHYICPSVWAWDKKRIDLMAKNLDLLLTIFPFEKECFSKTSLKVEYVGNPLYEYISKHDYRNDFEEAYPLTKKPTIAIFPGSRISEVKRNLSKQLHSALLFQKENQDISFAISIAADELKPAISEMINKVGLKNTFTVPLSDTYNLMKKAHLAIAKSGTVTLELALHKCPTVVVYELSKLNRFIAKYIIGLKLPFYCIVNILKNKKVFPELIEHGFDPHNLFLNIKSLYDGTSRKTCQEDCESILELFKDTIPSQKASLAIKEIL